MLHFQVHGKGGHYYGLACGAMVSESSKVTKDWASVECKNCLKTRWGETE